MKNKAFALAVFALLWLAVGVVCGFFIGKAVYNTTDDMKVERDTLIVNDTVPFYLPPPKDSVRIKYVARWFPVVDTVTRTDLVTMHDSVLIDVPITSKHYGSETYDAWVSGFEPSLDSIKVYQQTKYITERVTMKKPPNKVALSVVAGTDYTTKSRNWMPFAGAELMFNNHKRLQFGVEGGVTQEPFTKAWEPYAGAKVKIQVF